MDKCPSVSVIIPVYNGEKYLETIITSLARQTDNDFEAIIINDGSADGTEQALKRLQSRKHPFALRVINKENEGVSCTRNLGIREARGKRICFCDVDDAISPRYIELLSKALDDSGCRFALGYSIGEPDELYDGADPDLKVFEKEDFLREFLYHGNKYHHCCGMYDRSVFEGDMFYREGYRYSEDVHLLWRIIASSDSVAVVRRPLYCYIRNEGSAMHKKMTVDRMDAVNLMRDLEGYMDKNAPGFAEEFRKYAVARHHWSILWQAVGCFGTYREFIAYASEFDMKDELTKLKSYPGRREALSSRLFCFSPRIYYFLMRMYLKLFR